jgi:uncharacterized protein YbaP (TraB family)
MVRGFGATGRDGQGRVVADAACPPYIGCQLDFEEVTRMRLFHRLRRGLTTMGLAAIAGCAIAPLSPAMARPALWRVADSDTTVYLFGTIHMLPQDYAWRTPALEKALAKSDGLIVETLVDDKNPASLAKELAQLGYRDGLPPILNRVALDKRALLSAAIGRAKMPMTAFDRMETWAAAFLLLGIQFQQLDLKGSDGVENSLRTTFATAGKPIGQLETNREQLSFFDQLSEGAQRTLLEGSIESPEGMRAQFNVMLQAWTSGNVEAIAKSFSEELRDSPELRDVLLARRNANWAGWVERRMTQPGSVMIAVGAGHLAGDGSVQDMLKRRGYRVTRVQ